jgi:hypothetical protein
MLVSFGIRVVQCLILKMGEASSVLFSCSVLSKRAKMLSQAISAVMPAAPCKSDDVPTARDRCILPVPTWTMVLHSVLGTPNRGHTSTTAGLLLFRAFRSYAIIAGS